MEDVASFIHQFLCSRTNLALFIKFMKHKKETWNLLEEFHNPEVMIKAFVFDATKPS